MSDSDILKAVSKIEDPSTLVSIMILCFQMVDGDTVVEMARRGKEEGGVGTRRGILMSPEYRKEFIGKQQYAFKGEGLNDQKLPF